jgi:hypothetical protein
MSRSADGGISRPRQRRKERTRDAIGCNQPRSLALRGGRGRGRGERKDFGLNVAYRRQQGPVLSISGDSLPLRRRASSKDVRSSALKCRVDCEQFIFHEVICDG